MTRRSEDWNELKLRGGQRDEYMTASDYEAEAGATWISGAFCILVGCVRSRYRDRQRDGRRRKEREGGPGGAFGAVRGRNGRNEGGMEGGTEGRREGGTEGGRD